MLVDRNQNNLARDGIYLLDLPGILLRAVTRCVGDKVRVTEPQNDAGRLSVRGRCGPARVEELRLTDLLGVGRSQVSKVVGRAIWTGGAI